jgi:hypothetical protein
MWSAPKGRNVSFFNYLEEQIFYVSHQRVGQASAVRRERNHSHMSESDEQLSTYEYKFITGTSGIKPIISLPTASNN